MRKLMSIHKRLKFVCAGLLTLGLASNTAVADATNVPAEELANVVAPLPAATPETVELSAKGLAKLDHAIETSIEGEEISGAVIAIARRGKLAHFKAYGWQDKSENIPMELNSIFRIYSMTKPLVSAAAMSMIEEDKFGLDDAVSRYLPALTDLTVGNASERAKNAITVRDLLRHTSGLTYRFRKSPVRNHYRNAGFRLHMDVPLPEFVEKIAGLPLAYQPGTRWEYGRSIDVLGHLLEVVAGETLDKVLAQRIFSPLGMMDTAFHVSKEEWKRLAEPLKGEPRFFDPRRRPRMLAGGQGLVSTAADYLRFGQMLLNGGELDGRRVLKRGTVEEMTRDQLHSEIIKGSYYSPGEGYGHGLAMPVRITNSGSLSSGSVGELVMGAHSGTYFWADPDKELVVVHMMQSARHRAQIRTLLRKLIYSAIIK